MVAKKKKEKDKSICVRMTVEPDFISDGRLLLTSSNKAFWAVAARPTWEGAKAAATPRRERRAMTFMMIV